MKHDDDLVLVVDDHPDTLDLLSEYLTSKGFRVLTAASGPDALTIAETTAPKVVLLDISMPQMTGIEVARIFRERGLLAPGARIIATTGRTSQEEIAELERGSFDHLVAKPYALESLVDLMRA